MIKQEKNVMKFKKDNFESIQKYADFLAENVIKLVNENYNFDTDKYGILNVDHKSIHLGYTTGDGKPNIVLLINFRDINVISNIQIDDSKLILFIETNKDAIKEFAETFAKINSCVLYRVKNFLRLQNIYLSDNKSCFDSHHLIGFFSTRVEDENGKLENVDVDMVIPIDRDSSPVQSPKLLPNDYLEAIKYIMRSYLYDQESMFRFITDMEGC